MTIPFTFGIALLPRRLARDWALIEALLDLTLGSVLAQTDQDFRVILACHDRPCTIMDRDPRLTILEAPWPVSDTGPHNDDSGRKKHALNDRVLAQDGGLFMLLDADDWVDRRVVETSRILIGPDAVGGVIASGFVTDFQTLQTVAIPRNSVFSESFHRLCGSSTVALMRPEDNDAVRRDPFTHLRSHHRWLDIAQELGVHLQSLPLSGNYLVNTSENHSDLHGPHIDWRRTLIEAVNRDGELMTRDQADVFGLDPSHVNAVSRRFFPSRTPCLADR